jgi:fibronectin-binding autotransporter adhesin
MSCLHDRIRGFAGLTVLAAAIATCQNLKAATFLWNQPNVGPSNWTDSANWLPNTGTPDVSDTALFGAIGTGTDAFTVNNVVNANKTITALNYTNGTSGAWHVTQISAPNKLTVTSDSTFPTNFVVGGLNADGSITSVAMTGDGTLEVDGSGTNIFKVGNAGSASTSTLNATLDMSALNNFVYNAPAGTMIVAGAGTDARGGGVLNLAGLSNNITVGTINFNTGSGNNSSFHSLIQLGGGTNIFNVGTFVVCQTKAQFADVQFLNTASSTAGLRIRGTNGATDDTSRANITLGDRNNTGGGDTRGRMLLNGHPVDIKANTIIIGQDRSGSAVAGHSGTGVLQFDTGVVDATSIIMGNCITADTGTPSATGTLTVGTGGTLIVGSGGISLANQVHGTAAGILNISGTVICSNSIVKQLNGGNVTNAINITGGNLTLTSGTIGTAASPIENLNLTSARMTLPLTNGSSAISVTNYNPADDANVINITSVPVISGYPSLVPVIKYSALLGGGSVSLGTLPGTFKGYLTNDTTLSTVFLVLTNGPTTSKSDTWTGSVNGVWDTSTLNWTSASAPATYTEIDAVNFDDSSIVTNITVSTTHTPLSMAFNNNSEAYTLSGAGNISGTTGLTNSGAGSVTLATTGGDNFSGGITANAGTVILDNANSAITGAMAILGGATVQIGNNDANGNIPGSVANDGTLIINRADNLGVNGSITGNGSLTKLGNGILTLSNASPYFGNTIISKGTLALAGAGSISNSASVGITTAALDISGVASGSTFLNSLSLSDSAITLGNSNGLVPLMINSFQMGGTANTINVSALPTIASYPAVITLAQSPSGISGYNAVLGTLPAATPAYVGTLSLSPDTTAIQLTLTSGPIGTRTSVLWTGADVPNLNTNWSDRLNWQLPGAPTAADNVIFNATAAVSDAVTVDNIVDANTTINTLRFTNSVNGQWHVTEIPGGVTLTVSSNLTVGGLSGDGLVSQVAMTGGGTLAVNGTSLTIGNNGSGSSDSGTTLDLSGLSNFVYAVPTGTLTMGTGNRSAAVLKLASGSNYITATNFNDNIASSSSSSSGNLTLGGGTNIFNVANFNISAGRVSSTVSFPDVTGGLRVRGVGGSDSDRAAITLGNRNNGGGSGNNITGTLSLNGHPVDMKLSTLTMGESGSNPTGTANGNGILSYDTGTIDVNNIVMATATGTTVGVQAAGTINLGAGGTLIVGNGGINLGNRTGASGPAVGTLNIGGTVTSSGDIIKATNTATANITVTNGGTLKMLSGVIGTTAAPIDTLTLDTGTLQLAVNGSTATTNIVATTVAAANTTTINIGSVTGITAPATVSLISYTGTDPFPNLQLGTLPTGVTATLVDNQGNSTIDLNITTVPVISTPPTISKISFAGGNIIISGTNNTGTASTYHLLTSTNLALPLSSWSVVTNGSFGSDGSLNTTNAIDMTKPSGFYILQVP